MYQLKGWFALALALALADRIVWAVLGQSVGGGLPPMAVGQSLMSWLTHRHRGQAPSHSLIFMYQLKGGLLWLWLWPTGLYGRYSVKVWEGACPRWQWVSH
ncbi:hypothetical protein cym2001_35550 [Pseudomonas sp. CYM-20-01]|nr:hypothetical protein cym2001_35550 [Pseudomonas sp. CYM-20-01]